MRIMAETGTGFSHPFSIRNVLGETHIDSESPPVREEEEGSEKVFHTFKEEFYINAQNCFSF